MNAPQPRNHLSHCLQYQQERNSKEKNLNYCKWPQLLNAAVSLFRCLLSVIMGEEEIWPWWSWSTELISELVNKKWCEIPLLSGVLYRLRCRDTLTLHMAAGIVVIVHSHIYSQKQELLFDENFIMSWGVLVIAWSRKLSAGCGHQLSVGIQAKWKAIYKITCNNK